jgi:hypothetical protein
MSADPQTQAEALARLFHETYEALAPSMGYQTRKASAVPWPEVPDANRSLMIAVATRILDAWPAFDLVLAEVGAERSRQDLKWGEQNHPDGRLGTDHDVRRAGAAKFVCQQAAALGKAGLGGVTWREILDEEVAEAFAEIDPVKLRAELIQVAAVAVAWAQALDRRATATLGEAADGE